MYTIEKDVCVRMHVALFEGGVPHELQPHLQVTMIQRVDV